MAYILIAEDDQFLSDGLSKTLRHSGHKIDVARTGIEADSAVQANSYDLMVLDLELPQKNGLEILEGLRKAGSDLPVIILTARDTFEDRIKGLDIGANDYICKPFNVGELEARIRALLRKEKWSNRTEMRVGALSLDTLTSRFSINDVPLELSPREYYILEMLLQRKGRLVFKDDLLEHLAARERDMTHNALDIVIFRLRKKLENSGCVVQTVKGLGFIIE